MKYITANDGAQIAYATFGNTAQAHTLLDEAAAVARLIRHDGWRVRSVLTIAVAPAASGR